MGAVGTAGGVWWCLKSVEGRQIDVQRDDLPPDVGPLPETVRLHVRKGVFWLVARDQLPGVLWVNLERVAEPSTNPELDVPLIPSWADAPPALQERRLEGPAGRVGTLVVGWPLLAIGRQWHETDPTIGFIPAVENDDDGSTTAKAADRFFTSSPTSRVVLVPEGLIANTAFFAALAAPGVTFARFRARRKTPAHSAGR